ncbi:hypothetical protein Z042_06000 [Chania multitudinisentens RB-25]|uniref:Spore coat protein U/FanG domain-containing protein n=1 Tax=Chania multitudinisentens RB-25 TaxID=1441930 RepID=W0L5Y3_9GAMM|nr:spore coat protein U domain-containing protein [Chania multitudinisentens]AHG19218.1 hypothetical protein Z042_06000 [Chania multitudinisentens RB-25]
MKKYGFLVGIGLILSTVNPVFAGSTTGTINASLVLTSGCIVNGNTGTSNLSLGSLSFGTYNAETFTTADASLTNSTNNAITVKCSPGSTYTVKVTGSNSAPSGTIHGTVPTTAARYLVGNTYTNEGVAYVLSHTAAFAAGDIIANNATFAAAGSSNPTNGDIYPIFGRIIGVTDNTSIYADTYSDVIHVQVDY